MHQRTICPAVYCTTILVFNLMLNSSSVYGMKVVICGPGTHLGKLSNGTEVCNPCENDTFMNLTSHMFEKCFPCSKMTDAVETGKIVTECTQVSDAEKKCHSSFYRVPLYINADKFQCNRCTKCDRNRRIPNSVEMRGCYGDHDADCTLKCLPGYSGIYLEDGKRTLKACKKCDNRYDPCEERDGSSDDICVPEKKVLVKNNLFICVINDESSPSSPPPDPPLSPSPPPPNPPLSPKSKSSPNQDDKANNGWMIGVIISIIINVILIAVLVICQWRTKQSTSKRVSFFTQEHPEEMTTLVPMQAENSLELKRRSVPEANGHDTPINQAVWPLPNRKTKKSKRGRKSKTI